MEKGFLFQDAPFIGYTKAISTFFDKHGWGIFCLYPNDVFSKVVKKFYAHITSPDNAFIYVCNASILFDEDFINGQYRLFEGPNGYANFVKTMKLLLNPNAKDKEATTAPTHNQEPKGDEAKIEFVRIESDDEGIETTQTTTPTLQSKALRTAWEHAVHQLIDELTKSHTDDDKEEVRINKLKRKRFKKATGKTIQANSDD
ncbi:hypothetical protein J1N35_037679 [Gossypium stocksii]|uniref:Uncharacterized protein n=1 Tax=Gossypium stocksii TaxID=47602 RepID=A0A9D3ZM55_9ROSI|nr:hypothetical protein J1N35_037679 [Gossypium stocksii]